jgi:hypothetical protein
MLYLDSLEEAQIAAGFRGSSSSFRSRALHSAASGWRVLVTPVTEPLSEHYVVANSSRRQAIDAIRRRPGASAGELVEASGRISREDLAEMGLKPGDHRLISVSKPY